MDLNGTERVHHRPDVDKMAVLYAILNEMITSDEGIIMNSNARILCTVGME
ncbi:origin recognition complex subunit [Culex quinquefasciatus]|uniref:Origin recognition complex subunit n=1 Tax=Culex quinquefasciatus TaxID=7176 RepID=B0X5A9_CULQU|nr:origin recognition complex subunit [Culex quinquefasciatus]|eukprot:XP_001864831.1 origin recognition complex subunit [Culex quinquefasciatus]